MSLVVYLISYTKPLKTKWHMLSSLNSKLNIYRHELVWIHSTCDLIYGFLVPRSYVLRACNSLEQPKFDTKSSGTLTAKMQIPILRYPFCFVSRCPHPLQHILSILHRLPWNWCTTGYFRQRGLFSCLHQNPDMEFNELPRDVHRVGASAAE